MCIRYDDILWKTNIHNIIPSLSKENDSCNCAANSLIWWPTINTKKKTCYALNMPWIHLLYSHTHLHRILNRMQIYSYSENEGLNLALNYRQICSYRNTPQWLSSLSNPLFTLQKFFLPTVKQKSEINNKHKFVHR